MNALPNDPGFRQRMERIETLLEEARQFPDPKARATAQELVQGLLELHSAALERMLHTIIERGADGPALIDAIAEDDLTRNVLLLYGLHPADLETRVRQALDKLHANLDAHGGSIEILRIANGKVRARLQGDWHSISPLSLRRTIEDAIYDLAPDVTGVEIEGLPAAPIPEDEGHFRVALPLAH